MVREAPILKCGKEVHSELWWRFSISIDDQIEPVRSLSDPPGTELGLKMPAMWWV